MAVAAMERGDDEAWEDEGGREWVRRRAQSADPGLTPPDPASEVVGGEER